MVTKFIRAFLQSSEHKRTTQDCAEPGNDLFPHRFPFSALLKDSHSAHSSIKGQAKFSWCVCDTSVSPTPVVTKHIVSLFSSHLHRLLPERLRYRKCLPSKEERRKRKTCVFISRWAFAVLAVKFCGTANSHRLMNRNEKENSGKGNRELCGKGNCEFRSGRGGVTAVLVNGKENSRFRFRFHFRELSSNSGSGRPTSLSLPLLPPPLLPLPVSLSVYASIPPALSQLKCWLSARQ